MSELNVCVKCKRSEEITPLLRLTFKGEEKFICAQCLPLLIHKTQLLVEEFPGIEIPKNTEH